MYTLPKTVTVAGKEFKIRCDGDFRMVLDCLIALEDAELTKRERMLACLVIFYSGIDTIQDLSVFETDEQLSDAVREMFKFINCGQLESPAASVNHKLIDWQLDSHLLSSAINKVAGTEVRALPYCHWWTFMGYFLAIGDGTFAQVISIRNKILQQKKLEKWEREFRHNNPQYFKWDSVPVSKKELDDEARKMWNGGQ